MIGPDAVSDDRLYVTRLGDFTYLNPFFDARRQVSGDERAQGVHAAPYPYLIRPWAPTSEDHVALSHVCILSMHVSGMVADARFGRAAACCLDTCPLIAQGFNTFRLLRPAACNPRRLCTCLRLVRLATSCACGDGRADPRRRQPLHDPRPLARRFSEDYRSTLILVKASARIVFRQLPSGKGFARGAHRSCLARACPHLSRGAAARWHGKGVHQLRHEV